MPKTMRGKELLKRIFMSKLVHLPPEITDGMAEYTPPAVISHNTPTRNYKVLFALAHSI
jgi:hypothetical protein